MRKFRFLTTLFISALSMSSLAGCTTPTEPDVHAILPAPSEIQKDGLNIESITFENVPEGIPVGSFDSFGMKLKIVYSDGSFEEYPLLIENFPDNLKLLFNTVGKHTVTIAFRGQEVTYTFNVTEGQTFFLIRYFSYDGKIIQREQVVPSVGKVTAPAPSADKVKRDSDPLYHYDFKQWSEDLPVGQVITGDHDIYPEYQITQKRYDATKKVVPTIENSNLRLVKSNKGQYQSGAYIYVGRLDRVPLLYSASADKDSTAPPYSGEMCFEYADTTEQGTLAQGVINEIYSKGVTVDTTGFDDLFKPSSKNPITPEFTNANLSILNPDYQILFEGDTSYTEMFTDSIYNFVGSHGSSNKTSYNINPASNMLDGNKYYRAAIETSVDVFIDAVFNTMYDKYEFVEFTYYFVIDASKTYPVTEYTDSTGAFNSTGTKLTYSMADLDAIVRKVVEG